MVINVRLMDKHGPGYDGLFTILGWVGEAFVWDALNNGFFLFTFKEIEVAHPAWRNKRNYV